MNNYMPVSQLISCVFHMNSIITFYSIRVFTNFSFNVTKDEKMKLFTSLEGFSSLKHLIACIQCVLIQV